MNTKTKETKTLKKVVGSPIKTTLEDTNKKVIIQKVIVHRELKYNYPRGCKETLARKTFRQKVRNKIRKFNRDIAKLHGEDKKVMKEKLNEYQSQFLLTSIV